MVSSKVGQWPVVVNQDRTPYSTFEEYLGTYRIQFNQYTSDLVATGESYDGLREMVDGRANPVGEYTELMGIEDPIFADIAGETYGTYSLVDFNFIPEQAAVTTPGITYNIGFGGVITLPSYYDPVEESFTFMLDGIYYATVNPETKELEIPREYEGMKVYWFSYWTLGIPWSDFFYGDMVISQVEQAVLPAPSKGGAADNLKNGASASDMPASMDANASVNTDLKKKNF